jgi:hemerythrin-like domain-containing protein
MCEYCGCRQVEPIADLMDEHMELLEITGDLRRALLDHDAVRAVTKRDALVNLLSRHTGREEAGVFAALKAQGDYLDEVVALEGEHVSLDEAVAALDLESSAAVVLLDRLAGELSDHIDKENLGIFPVAVVTLGATGWDIVERAGERSGQPSGEAVQTRQTV